MPRQRVACLPGGHGRNRKCHICSPSTVDTEYSFHADSAIWGLCFSMRMISGAILILAAVQAFAHSLSIPFPNQIFAGEVLYPASIALAALGTGLIVWGTVSDQRNTRRSPGTEPDSRSAEQNE